MVDTTGGGVKAEGVPSGRSPAIAALNAAGQSVWYDNLSRAVLDSGELAKIVSSGVTGLTSNPTIFKKAIADSSDYDDDIASLARRGLGADEICEALFVDDVGRAADMLRPVFDATEGRDGYASVEVSPMISADTAATVEAGMRLWRSLDRPNVMVKVPATAEGVPAVRTLLERGVSVNVTLIFSVSVYRDVIGAYLGAAEARAARGEDVSRTASVASFFVSRVDAAVEKKLSALGKEGDKEFLGEVGIANCAVAYEAFREAFGGERWTRLAAAGARVQRPLWASTGTKNPAFSPVMYVDALAAPDTVNTVPPATLEAIYAGVEPRPRVGADTSRARDLLGRLAEAGVPLDAVLTEVQEEGVKSFRDSYGELLASVEAKRSRYAAA